MFRNNLGQLNVCQLDESSQECLHQYLQQHPDVKFLDKNKSHTFFNNTSNCEFTLSHSILWRARKAGKDGVRYEVINRELGRGAEGIVFCSLGVLLREEKTFLFKQKPRAVKSSKNITMLLREYKAASLTAHLHPKPVTIALLNTTTKQAIGYMTNRLQPGRNLHDVILTEEIGRTVLTADLRIDLSIAILTEINEAHARGLIHRDIKPENLITHLASLSVKLIDFSMAKILNDPDSQPDPGGSIMMMPIEQFYKDGDGYPLYSFKSDSYATGKTLAELWQAVAEVNSVADQILDEDNLTDLYYDYAKKDTAFDYANFLSGNLTASHQGGVQDIIEGLTKAHPDDRWSIDRALDAFNLIKRERRQTECMKTNAVEQGISYRKML